MNGQISDLEMMYVYLIVLHIDNSIYIQRNLTQYRHYQSCKMVYIRDTLVNNIANDAMHIVVANYFV